VEGKVGGLGWAAVDGPTKVGSWATLEGSGGLGWLARLVKKVGFEIDLVYISLNMV
jgi:hypothetical protein